MMSTLRATNIKHESSATNQIVLGADGSIGGTLGDTLAAKGDVAGETWTGTHDFSGATVTGVGGGLVPVHTETFSSVASVSVNGKFTSEYDNYRIAVELSATSTNLALRARTRLSGSDDTGSNYFTSAVHIGTTGAAFGSSVGTADTAWVIFDASDSTDTTNNASIDLWTPLSGKRKQGAGFMAQRNPAAVGYGVSRYYNKIVTTNYDGLTLYTSTGTASGVLRIYGYQNS